MFWDFLFYGIIAVGAILFVSLTIYRIDWARHPEKYKDIAGDEDPQKAEYRRKKRGGQKGRRPEGQGEGKAAQAAEARGQAEPLPRHQRQGACGHGRQAH